MSKTMSLRLDDAQSGALEMIARADNQSLTDAVRTAIEAHIQKRRADKHFQERLDEIIAEDREILERLGR